MYSSKTSQRSGKVTAAGTPGGGDDDDDDDSDRDARRRTRDNHLADANKRRAVRLNDRSGTTTKCWFDLEAGDGDSECKSISSKYDVSE